MREEGFSGWRRVSRKIWPREEERGRSGGGCGGYTGMGEWWRVEWGEARAAGAGASPRPLRGRFDGRDGTERECVCSPQWFLPIWGFGQ